MDDVRDSIHSEVTLEHLVVRQDVHNIKAQYDIEGVMRHANDLSSSAWVEEMKLPAVTLLQSLVLLR